MKFDELDRIMRIFETSYDVCVLPGINIVARLDGRSFTRLTKEKGNFEAPFDERFRDIMVGTVKHLMNCGFKVIYGYTESDEISLLFHPEENSFSRKKRKYESILAGEASACFSLQLNEHAVFDCRISQLSCKKHVIDYFRWRNEDSFRNSLNAYCYWTLRKDGYSDVEATKKLAGINVSEKNEILFGYGINFNDLPSWQKRGTGLYWKKTEKPGYDPVEKKDTVSERNTLVVDYELPMKDEYGIFIEKIFSEYQSE
jgi:tRNA(His) guanylyltransferase